MQVEQAGVCGGQSLSVAWGEDTEGEKGLCGSVSLKAGGAALKRSVFCPLSSCTSLSSGLFALNDKACLVLRQPEPSQISRDPLSRLLFLKYTTSSSLPRFYMLCPIISSFRKNFSKIFFHKIMPPIGFLFFFMSLLLLAEEHGGVIAVYVQTSWRLEE